MLVRKPAIFLLAPSHWAPLRDALTASGYDRCYSLLGGQGSYNLAPALKLAGQQTQAFANVLAPAWTAGSLDTVKALRAAGVLPPDHDRLDVQPYLLAYHLTATLVALAERDKPHCAVTTCTYDAPGRALVDVCRQLGIPVVHVQHGCHAFVPEDAWFAAEAPGDVVCVSGERDREWWRRCQTGGGQPAAKVEVTGHPLWDGYHGLARVPHEGKVVLWAAESGANAAQTPAYWHSRDVPERAWQAFLDAMRKIETTCEVVVKVREGGEEQARLDHWRWMAGDALRDTPHRLTFSTEAPREVLPRVDVVVCQDSNLGVEALHLGIPVVSVTREGSGLFRACGDVECVAPEASQIAAAVARLLGPHCGDAAFEARYYNRGVDGQAMARVVAAIDGVVR